MSASTTAASMVSEQQPLSRGTRPGASRSVVHRVLAALLLLGALGYAGWTVEAFLPTGLSPLSSYVSELAAQDQPYGTFFRTVDFLAGLLVLAGAVGALVRRERREWWGTAGWAGLALFGAATAVDARVLPLSCAPTADAGCAAREGAGDVPWTHSGHAFSSSLAVAGALVAMVLLTVAARRSLGGAWAWPALARGGPVLVVLELVATGWTLASVAAFEAGRGTWGLGVGQRLQVLFIAVWIAVLAWSMASSAARRG
ncbi:DUF998 domain-containing protein [Streptomyces sp. NPDC041068]|uniref:DUF998 domain-containing protein n=1 Tax=Streptomyces sp. NPDC041068 TaxID=3155130 RepID=UPI0033EA8F8C